MLAILLATKNGWGATPASSMQPHGCRRGSGRLTAGVSLELVQKVTWHKTTDIVLQHYFQPGREEFRQALNAAMPKLLANGREEDRGHRTGKKSPKDQIREIAQGMKGKTWKRDKARLLELVERMK